MSKDDPFQMLVGELTALRRSVEALHNTSLTKSESKTLNADLTKAVAQMAQTGPTVQRAIETRLATTASNIRTEAISAAESAARGAIEKSHAQVLQTAQSLSEAAGEARRQAWRYFGGFWVWLAAMLAIGAVLGGLATLWVIYRGDATAFGQYPGIFCSDAGGVAVKNDAGRTFCAIWIDPPQKAGK